MDLSITMQGFNPPAANLARPQNPADPELMKKKQELELKKKQR